MDIDKEIIRAVEALYGDKAEPVRPAKICKKVARKIGIDPFGFGPEMIDGALAMDPNYEAVFEECEEDDYFFSRRALFQGARFCIRLTDFEIRNGALVSGHRFVPFFKPLDKVKLLNKDGGKAFHEKKKGYLLDDIRIYYTLFGPKGLFDILTAEHEDNSSNFLDALLAGDPNDVRGNMKITVYDMKDFFAENGLKENDLLFLTVKNYEKGICEVEALRQADLKDRAWERAEWLKLLSDSLKKSIDSVENNGYMELIDTFLARAFFFGGKKLMQCPPAAIVSILDGDSEFEIKLSSGGYAMIWEKDRPFELEDEILDMAGDDGPGNIDEEMLEALEAEEGVFGDCCNEMGFSCSMDELEAYMRDELFASGGKTSGLARVIARCFDERIDKHYPHLKEPFFREVDKIWERVSGSYNIFQDNPQGKIRRKALEILDQHNTWIRGLDKKGMGRTPELGEILKELMQVMGPIYGLIAQFNRPSMDFKPGQAGNFDKMLDLIKVAHRHKLDEADGRLGI